MADPEFRKWVEKYARDEKLFFKVGKQLQAKHVGIPRFLFVLTSFACLQSAQDFASAFSKLLHLGVPVSPAKPWYQFW